MFEKALGDLVRGIRAHTRDEAGYIAGCISEIKEVLLWGALGTKPMGVTADNVICHRSFGERR